MEWQSIVGSLSPYLGAALGGPLGASAVATIADALGLSEKTEAAISQVMQGGMSPDQMLSIKTAEQDFALRMQEMGFANARDLEAIAANDRDSARRRETSVLDKTPRNLAYLITAGFFGVLMFIMVGNVQDGMNEVLYIMLGALGASWQSSVNYYFGSTRGSQAKTALLAKAEAIKE